MHRCFTPAFHSRVHQALFLLAAACACLLTFDDASANNDSTRTNVVFAFADDLGRYASAYADPSEPSANDVVSTPNFDGVVAEGVLFDNAFVSVPSCTPSRAAFLTGRHFFRNGSHSQLHHPWHTKGVPENKLQDPWTKIRGMGLTLADAGYHIGWSYKMHVSENRMGGKKRNYIKAGTSFNRFSQVVSAADDTEAAKAKLLNEVRQNFDAFLSDRDADQPFFYWFNPTNTHRDWVKGSGKKLWGIEPNELKGKLPAFLPDDEVIREDFADYLGEAMAFDASIGVLIEKLKSIDQWDNTLLIISGDHGAPGFPRGKCNLYDFGTQVLLGIRMPRRVHAGVRIKSPVSLIDLAPTILDVVGVEPTEKMDGQSLLPAIAKSNDPNMSAREELLRGWVLTGRENHVDQARPGGLPYPMRAIRNRDYLYIHNFAPDRWPVAQPPIAAPLTKGMSKRKGGIAGRRMDLDYGPTRDFFERYEGMPQIADSFQLGFGLRPAEELYDVRNDPDQVNNLAGKPEYESVQTELRQQLMDLLSAGEDPRVTTTPPAFDHPPYTRGDDEAGFAVQ